MQTRLYEVSAFILGFSALSGISRRSLRLKAFDLIPILENALRIDDYKDTAAAGEDGALFVGNFGDPREPPPTFADLS